MNSHTAIFVTEKGHEELAALETTWEGAPGKGTIHALAKLTGIGVKTAHNIRLDMPISQATADRLKAVVKHDVTEKREV